MPVELSANSAPSELRWPGAVPVSVDFHGSKIIPVLMLSGQASSDLLPLTDHQRLVLSTVADESFALRLFPDVSVIVVHGQLPSGSWEAWEALDGLVTDEPMSPGFARQFLSRGTSIASTVPPRADDRLPWAKVGNGWIVHSIAADLSKAAPAAYAAMDAWQPPLSTVQRRELVAIGCLCALVSLASLLYLKRGAALVRSAIALSSVAGLLAWRASMQPLHSLKGSIVFDQAGVEQADDWTFTRARRPAHRVEDGPPLLSDMAQANAINLVEHVRLSGNVEWVYSLRRDELLVELTRRCLISEQAVESEPHGRSPLLELAKTFYGKPGNTIQTIQTELMNPEYSLPTIRVTAP